ncbi:hypothetical protein ACOMCU_00260 [Lysinibacillus sp. UGB7]|uniref:hypothetical protein n=1 Tax=Lysinibacillus sp. UGB7 TaxID=3411039 RepID=UPI003B7B8649
MIAGFYTVIVGLIGIFVIRSLLIKRDNGIPFKGGVVMLLTTLLITFGNSFIEGGKERIAEMFQLNMIISSFCGIVIGGMFFWKRRDIFAYLDKNKLLFNWKVTPSGTIENFEEWQKEQELTKEKAVASNVSHSKSEFVPKEDVLKRIREDRERIKGQGSDPTPQLRFETGKELSEEESHRQLELDEAKKRQRQIEQEEADKRRREREREEERQRQQNITMQQNAQHASNYPSYEDHDCGSNSSGSSSSSYDCGSSSSSSSSSDSGSSSCD